MRARSSKASASSTRVETPSLSCRLIRPVAIRIYVQWPELARAAQAAMTGDG